MNRLPIVVVSLLAALGLSTACSGQSVSTRPALDGVWWEQLSPENRTAFMMGFYECYLGDRGGPPIFHSTTMSEHADSITAYYARTSHRTSEDLLAVALAVGDVHSTDTSSASRRPSGHTQYDGLVWMGLYEKGARGAFLGGYVSCYHRFFPNEVTRYQRPVSEYEAKVSAWYGLDVTAGRMDPARQRTPVIEVLQRVDLGQGHDSLETH